MEKRTRLVARSILQLLSDEELRQAYSSTATRELADSATRAFIIEKILDEVPTDDLLRADNLRELLPEKIGQLVSAFRSILMQFEKADLIALSNSLSKQLLTEDMRKDEIVDKILVGVPVSQIIESEYLRKKLKSRKVERSQKEEMLLRKGIGNLQKNLDSISDQIVDWQQTTATNFEKLLARVQSVEKMFDVGAIPDLYDYLQAFYEEAAGLGEKLTPDDFHEIDLRLREKLKIDDRTLILKGIELLLAHYFLTQVKGIQWKPPLDQFLKIFKEEFSKIQIIGDKAEIPALRDRICSKMGMSDAMFDQLLLEAWENNLVKLEPGAPIGEYNVKYLVTEDGKKFYYVKM